VDHYIERVVNLTAPESTASESSRIALAPRRALFDVPSSSQSLLVQCLLVVSTESMNGLLNLAVHMVSGIQCNLTSIPCFAAVTEFDSFPFAESIRATLFDAFKSNKSE
jgi:hypothetical protein